ncbi:histidine phosphatase family protein [Asaia bogorensis]|uniref:histidine phosphatase family protein n=1 Tax=Asaia bogorensis TaxID=91915 RepID=UPI000EFBEFAB|nr:histidine phosphatase family protein [Asaia bogorensis]
MLLARHPAVQVAAGLCYGRLDVDLAAGWQDCVAGWKRIWCDGMAARSSGTMGAPLPSEVRVFHAPASRCARSAQLLVEVSGQGAQAGQRPMACESDSRLAELNFGTWENRLWSDVPRDALDEWAANPMGYAPGGGETVQALSHRVTGFWQERMAAAQDCCIVTHGGPLRVMLALAERRPFEVSDPAPAQGAAILLHFFNNPGGFVAQKSPIR